MAQSQVIEAEPLHPSVLTCDRDGCPNAAVQAYQFPWGEKGVCCATHGFLLNQAAEQINRSVQLTPLVAPGPEPLLRPERVRLTAEVLVLKEELEDAKTRGLDLYRNNGELTRQVQSLTVQQREAKAQLTDQAKEITQLRGQLEEARAENGELVLEVERLRTLEAFTNPPQNPGGNVVDG